MHHESSIGVLNNFIQINNDRIIRHKTASSVTQEVVLKNIFDQCITTSQQCNQELFKEVTLLGGRPILEDTATSSTFIKAWIDVEKVLESKDTQTLLSSSLNRESVGMLEYKKVLHEGFMHLSRVQQQMVERHIQQLKADHENVSSLNYSR